MQARAHTSAIPVLERLHAMADEIVRLQAARGRANLRLLEAALAHLRDTNACITKGQVRGMELPWRVEQVFGERPWRSLTADACEDGLTITGPWLSGTRQRCAPQEWERAWTDHQAAVRALVRARCRARSLRDAAGWQMYAEVFEICPQLPFLDFHEHRFHGRVWRPSMSGLSSEVAASLPTWLEDDLTVGPWWMEMRAALIDVVCPGVVGRDSAEPGLRMHRTGRAERL